MQAQAEVTAIAQQLLEAGRIRAAWR